MIMKVACFFSQHSPIFGQPASSQTVTRPLSRTMRLRLRIAARDRRLDADPVRLAQHGRVRPVRLFRVARPACHGIEDDNHGISVKSLSNYGFRASTASRHKPHQARPTACQISRKPWLRGLSAY